MAAGESYRGKKVHKEQWGLEADSTQEPLPLFVLKPMHPFSVSLMCHLFIPLCQHSSALGLCAALVAIQMLLDPM